MGWISDRAMKRGHGLNIRPQNNGSGNGPLRKIEHVLINANCNFFGKDTVMFECGHEGTATINAKRGRCKQCNSISSPIQQDS